MRMLTFCILALVLCSIVAEGCWPDPAGLKTGSLYPHKIHLFASPLGPLAPLAQKSVGGGARGGMGGSRGSGSLGSGDRTGQMGQVAPQIDSVNIPQMQPLPKPRPPDAATLKRDADELARLAGAIPPKIEEVTSGKLPKDLNEQLKQIEKLSKRLRREIGP
jgi:hypothetical protein